MQRIGLAFLATGAWINLSEFLRNELLFKHHWLEKFQSLGLTFPSTPVHNAVWVLWGFILAGCIVALARRVSFIESVLVMWTAAFVLGWVILANLELLPLGLLWVAVPWSLVEVAVAVLIARKVLR